jgi:monoamine oxidase
MSRSRLFDQLARAVRVARLCEEEGLSTQDGLEKAAEISCRAARARASRRQFLGGAAAVAAAALARPRRALSAPASAAGKRIAIIGGGLAGLACADRLQSKGVQATVYEGNRRLGGRIWTQPMGAHFGEVGGEMIDNAHKTVLAYATEFKLAREDYGKIPGDGIYYFGGRTRSEAEVIGEWRELSRRMQPDLRSLSAEPSYAAHTPADEALDRMSLADYLESRGRGLPLIQAVLREAYISEYGREPHEQSSLNLLLFIHLDRRSKFHPFGASDERYHLTEGNDGIIRGLSGKLARAPQLGALLTRLSRNGLGEYEMTFGSGPSATVEKADAVVLAIPFSVLRTVTLDPSLGLSAAKLAAIQNLGYGYNAKTKILFNGRPWGRVGGDGSIYSDLPNLQNTWESSHARAGATSLLTDYAGGTRGRGLQEVGAGFYCGSCHGGGASFFNINDTLIQQQADAFLTNLDTVVPGARAAAVRGAGGGYVVRRGHWLPQRTARGSYTCYLPGQFTTVAGLEGQSAGALKFAGEHADSFYMYQGFMEGAARSGIAAADELLGDIRAGRI